MLSPTRSIEHKILIIDSDEKFLSQILKESSQFTVKPIICESVQDARLKLSDPKIFLQAIVVSFGLGHTEFFRVLHYCHLYQTGIPIYILLKNENFSAEQAKNLGIQDLLKKPIDPIKLSKLVSIKIENISDLHPTSSASSLQNSLSDQDFHSIPSRNFLMGLRCNFNLYIKVKPTHYLKILNSGDAVPYARIKSYIEKGIDRFFIRKVELETYLKYCDQLSGKLLENENIPITQKTSQILHAGEQTLRFIAASGVTQDNINYAEKFVERNLKFIDSINLTQHQVVSQFLEDIQNHEHSAAVAIFSSLIAKELGFENERIQRILGLAALLHDIGLYKLAPNLIDEEVWKMNFDEVHLFHQHPEEGAKILAELRAPIEASTIQAIAQHHERRNGKGFPGKNTNKPINQLAEIIGISDEFIQSFKTWKLRGHNFDIFKDAQKRIFNGFSFPIINAFQAVFKRTYDA